MHYLYILKSESVRKFYVGETNNIEERLIKHNQHSYSNSFTKMSAKKTKIEADGVLERVRGKLGFE